MCESSHIHLHDRCQITLSIHLSIYQSIYLCVFDRTNTTIVLISICLLLFFLSLLQVQFLIVFVHTIQIQFQPSCNFPKPIGLLLTFNAGLFTYMFSSFYIRSYTKKHPSKSELNDVDRSKVCYTNGTVDKLNNSIAEKTKEALNVQYKKLN